MKQLLGILIAILMTTSQASMSQNGNAHYGNPTVTVVRPQTVTRNVQVRVSVPRVHRPKLFVGNPRKNLVFAQDRDSDILEIDDVITSYRRRDLVKIEHPDGLSEKVRWRLFLSRQLAMIKYREVRG